jgi:hypothetical protein
MIDRLSALGGPFNRVAIASFWTQSPVLENLSNIPRFAARCQPSAPFAVNESDSLRGASLAFSTPAEPAAETRNVALAAFWQ